MLKYLIAYAATAVVLVGCDIVWLRLIATGWYEQGIGHLMAGQINVVAGVLFYALFPIGLLIFAVRPHLDGPLWHAALAGGLFGFFAYATYDLTNLATLKQWPVGLSVLDVAWGTAVSAVSAMAGRSAASIVA